MWYLGYGVLIAGASIVHFGEGFGGFLSGLQDAV